MNTIVIIAIAYICAVTTVGLVAAVVVLRDVAISKRTRNAEVPAANEEAPTGSVAEEVEAPESEREESLEETEVCAAGAEKTASENFVAEAAETEEEKQEEAKPEADVNFSTDKLTLEEKYLKLPGEMRAYYDELVRYSMSVKGHKRYKNANYEEYKVGKNRLVRIRIKNDVITCELTIPNFDLKNYVADNKIDLRQSATVVKVVDEASLNAVKGCMDIALAEIEREREYKKEQAKARRRERRAAAKAASAEAAATTDETNGNE